MTGYGGWAAAVASVTLLGSVVSWSVATAERPSVEAPPLIAGEWASLKIRAETIAGRYGANVGHGAVLAAVPVPGALAEVYAIDAAERPAPEARREAGAGGANCAASSALTRASSCAPVPELKP